MSISKAFKQGFMDKLAELKKSAGPRPKERDAVKRITHRIASNPELLDKFISNGKMPPRGDDPVWNSGNVQKWVTGLSLVPAVAAPVAHGASGLLKTVYTPSENPTVAGQQWLGQASLPIAGLLGSSQYLDRFKFLREMSDLQRQRDAEEHSARSDPDKYPVWTHVDYLKNNGMGGFSDNEILDQAIKEMDLWKKYPDGRYIAKTQSDLDNYNKWFPGRGVLASSLSDDPATDKDKPSTAVAK